MMTAESPGSSRSLLRISTYEGLAGPWPDPAGLQHRSKLQIISTQTSSHLEKGGGGGECMQDWVSWQILVPGTPPPPSQTAIECHVWWWRWRHLKHLNFEKRGRINGVWAEDKEDIFFYWKVISSKTRMNEWMNEHQAVILPAETEYLFISCVFSSCFQSAIPLSVTLKVKVWLYSLNTLTEFRESTFS